MKVLASALLGLLSVPMLGYGGYLFVCWFRIHTSDVYYSAGHVLDNGWAGAGRPVSTERILHHRCLSPTFYRWADVSGYTW
jgi:hypothetical protein